MDDGPAFTIPEVLEATDYDPRQAARSVASYAAMVGLGVVIGAVFTALVVAHSMEPIGMDPVGVFEPARPRGYRLTLDDLVRARDYVALVGLAVFLAGAVALGALEAEWL